VVFDGERSHGREIRRAGQGGEAELVEPAREVVCRPVLRVAAPVLMSGGGPAEVLGGFGITGRAGTSGRAGGGYTTPAVRDNT